MQQIKQRLRENRPTILLNDDQRFNLQQTLVEVESLINKCSTKIVNQLIHNYLQQNSKNDNANIC